MNLNILVIFSAIFCLLYNFFINTASSMHRLIAAGRIRGEILINNKEFSINKVILYYKKRMSIEITQYFIDNKDINKINLELIKNIVNQLDKDIILDLDYKDFRLKFEYSLMNETYISYWTLYSPINFIDINQSGDTRGKEIQIIKDANDMNYPPYTKEIIDKFLNDDILEPYFIKKDNLIDNSLQGSLNELKNINYIKLYNNDKPELISIFTKIAGPINDYGLLSKRAVNLEWIFEEYPEYFENTRGTKDNIILEINQGLFIEDGELGSESINMTKKRSLIISPKVLKLVKEKLYELNKNIEFNIELYHGDIKTRF